MVETPRWRAAFTVFGWATAILVATACFFWTALAVEVPWMQRVGGHGTGTVTATFWLTAPFLVILLGAAFLRFRDARWAVLLGWSASLPLFAALYAAGYSYSHCAVPGC